MPDNVLDKRSMTPTTAQTSLASGVIEFADRLKELKDEKEALDDALKAMKARIEATTTSLVDAMVNAKMPNFSRAGTMFYLSTKLYASPVAKMKSELFDALREHGEGALVYETVNSNTLSSFVKEQREANDGDTPKWLADFINVNEEPTVNMRKASAKNGGK